MVRRNEFTVVWYNASPGGGGGLHKNVIRQGMAHLKSTAGNQGPWRPFTQVCIHEICIKSTSDRNTKFIKTA